MKKITTLILTLLLTTSPLWAQGIPGNLVPITTQNAAQLELLTVIGKGIINALAWSPDGETLAVGTSVSLELYNADLTTARSLLTGDEYVNALAWSPDGETLAVGTSANIHLYDTDDFSTARPLLIDDLSISGLAFTPDGSLLAASSFEGLHLLDPTTGLERALIPGEGGANDDLIFTADGKLLVWNSFPSVRFINLGAALKQQISCTLTSVTDGNLRSSAGTDAGRVGQVRRGTEMSAIGQSIGTDGMVWWEVSPRGQWVRDDLVSASGCEDVPIVLQAATEWNLDSLSDSQVTGNAIESLLATTHYDTWAAAIRLWYSRLSSSVIRSAAASEDGHAIVFAGSLYRPPRHLIWLIDGTTGETLSTLSEDYLIAQVDVNQAGTRLASSSDDGILRIWDAATGTAAANVSGYGQASNLLQMSPDLRLTAAVLPTNNADTIVLNDVARGSQRALEGFDQVLALAFSPDAAMLAVADRQAVSWWETRTGLKKGEARADSVRWRFSDYGLSWSADGQRLAFPGAGNTAEVWDVGANRRIALFNHPLTVIPGSVTLSADGSAAATTAGEDRIWLWDVNRSVLRGPLHPPDSSRIARVFVSSTADQVALMSWRQIEFWNLDVGARTQRLSSLENQAASVWVAEGWGMALNADWSLLAEAGDDLIVRDANSGEELIRLPGGHTRSVTRLFFSSDDRAIVSISSDDGTIRVWGVRG